MSCLIYALLYWNDNKNTKIVYDSNHVLCIFPDLDISDKGFLDIKEFGYDHMKNSFNLKKGYYHELLKQYYE